MTTDGESMADRELMNKRITLQRVRNTLKTVEGVEVLHIYEESEPALDRVLDMLGDLGYTSYSKLPDSSIDEHTDDASLYEWVAECIGLEKGAVFFLRCEGFWVKIRIADRETAARSLWNDIEPRCKGFTVLNEKMDRFMDIGNDSRDEQNYLFDEYHIPEFDIHSYR